jgi:ribonuclease D
MGFYIYDSNGYVGDLASNKGLDDLSVFIRKYSDGDELNSLFENGHVLKTEHLLEEIKRIGIPKDPDIRDTLKNLKTLIKKSSDVVIITQEAEVSEEGED